MPLDAVLREMRDYKLLQQSWTGFCDMLCLNTEIEIQTQTTVQFCGSLYGFKQVIIFKPASSLVSRDGNILL